MKKLPKYKLARNYIRKKIKAGEYLPGDKLPTESELSKILGVSSITIKKAMTELVNEGLICRIQGRGSFVNELREKKGGAMPPSNKLIAFLLSCQDVNDSSCMQIMMGIQRCLSSAGFSLIVENPGDDPEEELRIIRRLLDNDVAGFILFSANPELSLGNYIYLKNNNVPFVLMDRLVDSIPVNSVACNNQDGAFSAVEYLIELQHRRIGFVADQFYLSSEKERFQGYCNAMQMASLPLKDNLLFLDSEINYRSLANMIKSGELTALFAVNDRKGLELINKLMGMGIRIPEDVSVIGFDDYEASSLARIPMSTVRQHFEEEGYTAAKILLGAIEGSDSQFNKIRIGTKLIIRSSTEILQYK